MATIFKEIGFIATGIGTHGLYPSRDGTKLYVANRGSHRVHGPPSRPGQHLGDRFRHPQGRDDLADPGRRQPRHGQCQRRRQDAVAVGPLRQCRLRDRHDKRPRGQHPGRPRAARACASGRSPAAIRSAIPETCVNATSGGSPMSYDAPLADMRFVLEEVAQLDAVARLPGFEAAAPDLAEAILGEAARLAGGVLAPLNQPADRAGSVLENGVVRTPSGFREAYARYRRRRLERPRLRSRARRSGPAPDAGDAGLRDVERGLHGLRAVPAADRRRGRIAAGARLGGSRSGSISASWSPASGPAR